MGYNGKVVINGEVFESLTDACRHFGISYNTVKRRLESGMNIENAVMDVVGNNKKYVLINGELFNSITDACNHFGISYNTVNRRLEHGMDVESAVMEVVRNKKYTFINGKLYKNISEACREYNISRKVVDNRLRLGWGLEDAILTPVGTRTTNIEVTVDGKKYRSIRAACKAYGMEYATVMHRIWNGMEPEQALKSPKQGCKKYRDNNGIVFKGKKFNTLKEVAEYYKVDYKILKSRINIGMPLEKAVYSGRYRSGSKGTKFKMDGIEFPSILDACIYYSISYDRVMRHRRKGIGIEQSLRMEIEGKRNNQ